MKKLVTLLLCLMLVLPAFALAEEDNVLNITSWVGYIDDTTLAAFEEETGVKVVWSPMDNIDDMLLKVTQGSADYDLILSSDYSLAILREGGYLQAIDKTKLANYANLYPNYLDESFDPTGEYAVPYMAGSPLIIYDAEKVPFEITGYEDLWDERLKDSVAVLENARVLCGITFKTLGMGFNTTDPDSLAQMKEKLMKLYPNIRVFGDNDAYTAFVSGEASVMFNFSPFCLYAYNENPNLKVVYPKEGLGIGVDGFVIPANAKHADNAYKLLDYLMIPEVAAYNCEYQGYMNVNSAAEPYLSAQFVENPVLNVPNELLNGAEYVENVGEAETTFQEIYTAFKNQQ